MKTFSKFLTFGAMAALMSACSNDNVPDAPGAQNPTTDGGYLAVNIQLPIEPSTRAANDVFDDGKEYEYAVNNAALVLFQGDSEAEASFVGAYVLVKDAKDEDSDKNDNITVSHQMVAKISNSITGNGSLYALALVNYNNDIATIGTDGTLTIGGSAFTGTFKDLLWKTSSDSFYSATTTSNFFMTNAPLCTAIGGPEATSAENLKYENVFTLAPFEKDKIKPTRNEAIDEPAANIYVERAVAKVTMNWSLLEGKEKFELDERDGVTAELVGWTVNNTESSSYIVRNLGLVAGSTENALDNDYLAYTSSKLKDTNYRFVGHSKMGSTATLHPNKKDNLYRTYWCVDPHYSTALAQSAEVNTIPASDWVGVDQAFYPHENTFSVANQNFKNTTRALLKVKINVDGAGTNGTFYMMNDKIYANMEKIESFALEDITTNPGLLLAIEKALKAESETSNSWEYKKGDFELKYTTENGKKTLTDVKFAGQLSGKNIEFDFSDIIDNINYAYEILEYTGGICYYDLKIMHFASNSPDADLAPWTASETESETTTEAAYENNSADYLGRYGMVRNNWYDINVTGVADIGSPVVPDAFVETSDDNNEVERYIAFRIHILSWAKRTNDYVLK
ncbi:MAG: Mfa1 family fimbria major subunit [Bacteroidales bacterium]|nr:Mfa1 family fimbria major subunit [Bacteroidales bacterium]